MSLFSRSTSKLGIDIGTSSIKIVQLKKEQAEFSLETYGIVSVSGQFGQEAHFNAISETAEILKQLLQQSHTTTNKVVASLPSSVVFVTMIEMPKLSEKELKQAIEFEARRYIPLPLEEVTTAWNVLEEPGGGPDSKVQVLLTAVPSVVIENYVKMFKLTGLQPQALEIEALALIRSLLGSRKEGYIIIDIGGRSTSLNLVDRGLLRVSRNVLVGGETITTGIAQNLKISLSRAEQFKRDLGLTRGLAQQIPQAMRPALDRIKNETAGLLRIYESGGGTVQEIILAGNEALLPGLVQYFSDLGPRVVLGDPLKFIAVSGEAKATLNRKALALSVAVGLAMRE